MNRLSLEQELWNKGYRFICGVDEAGRGPLCGPVIAGAFIIPVEYPDWILKADDSKKLTEKKRLELYQRIISENAVHWATGEASAAEIDKINIYQATRLAMTRAIEKLPITSDYLLLDAMLLPSLSIPQKSVIHGDALSIAIGCASILAKVTRDQVMTELDKEFPAYLWAKNKGYGTRDHLLAIEKHGPTPHHRMTFAPLSTKKIQQNNLF